MSDEHGEVRESGVPPTIVELCDVYKIYGRGATEVRALDGVSLTIRAGEFVAIMGPSGSGKSTCMNIIGCLDSPSAGQYIFSGVDVGTLGRDERALVRRHFMGFVFQSYNLLPRTSALSNVELPLVYEGIRPALRHRRAVSALAAVGLADRQAATSAELSGGQQQRVAIARALVTEPPVLLADEPTGNLDTVMAREVMTQLTDVRRERGVTVVMVTHEPDIARYADRVLLFTDGKLVRDGTPAEVLA